MSNETTSKNKIKNYIILVVIFLLCMGLVLYFCKWYKVYDEYQKETPVIRDSLFEIVSDDLEHYVLENPSTVIYMCTATNNTCRTFEKDFKKLIKQDELSDDIVYLNLSDLDQDEFVSEFNSKYNYKIKLTTDYPAFVLFEDGKVVSVLQGSDDSKLTISKVKQFLELNDIGE
jgi:predicted bacteriocin transport accessory protein